MKNDNALAVMENFQLVGRYEGLSPEEIEEIRSELEYLDIDDNISCRKIRIPSGGATSYEIQGDNDDYDSTKTIDGVIIFTHRISAYWPNSYGANAQDKLPYCASMDGVTGLCPQSGEVQDCETCQWNQYGTAVDQQGNPARGKACKNMRRIYIMRNADPNVYLLTVPPSSLKNINSTLKKLVPCINKVVTFSLEHTTNASGTQYSKVILKRTGLLSPQAAVKAKELRKQIEAQYKDISISTDDYQTAPERGKPVNVYADDFDSGASDGCQQAPPMEDIPMPDDQDVPF